MVSIFELLRMGLWQLLTLVSLVWARLQSLCIPSTSFINVPPLLDASFGYTIPQDGTVCQCNVVSYALMAGCTWQVGLPNNFSLS